MISLCRRLLIFVLVLTCFTSGYAQTYRVLFDNSKSQTAGNADWKIDDNEPYPDPASPTAETDWLGGISAWGYELWNTTEYQIVQLPYNGTITYGESTDTDLSNFDVFVCVEPNNAFSDTEKAAILDFVEAGGGLFCVADHTGSDRDSDGIDSPAVWNDLFNNNPRSVANIFGVTYNINSISGSYSDIRTPQTLPEDIALFSGTFGSVTGIAYHAGASMTVNTISNADARGQIWTSSAKTDSDVVVATSRFGSGRIAFVGDSSPCDDGTGAPGDTLYDGWNETGVTDREIFLNLTEWLAQGGTGSGISIGALTLDPDPVQSNTVETVSCDITDDGTITGATLYYRTLTDATFTSVAMSNTTGDTWEGQIPGQENTIVLYRVTATDNDTNTASTSLYTYQLGSVSICDLRNGANDADGVNRNNGLTVTVSGIVTAPTLNCYGSSGQTDIYIQDASGCGINIYNSGSDSPQVNLGDTVSVTGTVTQYNGKLELLVGSTGTSMTVTGTDTTPSPNVITCSQMGEDYEGMLLRINDVTVAGGTIPASGSSGPITVQDATGQVTLYIDRDGSIDGMTTPSGTFDVIGIGQQYDNSSPYTDGYQVNPRFTSDFITGSGPVTYTLNTSVGSGNGSVTPSGSNTYDSGTIVSVTPTADSGYDFDHWSGDASGSANPLSVTMDGDKTIQAHFVVEGTGGDKDLYFSEYLEGSSFNKAFEIFNETGATVDLSTYTVERYNNGASTPNDTYTLSEAVANLADGDVLVIAHGSASLPGITANADALDGICNFNGDDALVLKNNGVVIDCIGQVGVDPGSYWGSGDTTTQNHTLRRKPTVHQGDTTVDDAFDPATEWDGYAEDTADGLGSHTATYTLSVTVGSGSGSVDPSGSSSRNYGSTISVSATPDTGFVFDHWEGDVTGATNPVDVTINGDITMTAHFVADGAVTGVYFSEYVEGSSTNKALEIFNESGAAIDFSTDNYIIEIYNNGATSPTNTVTLTGTLADGAAFVVADPALAAYADQTTSSVSFNGDDAIVLKKDGASGDIVDSIGQVGVDPGSAWTGAGGTVSTVNMTLRRKGTIHTGDTTADDAFDPSVQWDAYAQDTFGDLGDHTAEYTLATNVGTGSGSVSPSGSTTRSYGEEVTLEATADAGYSFDGWTGDLISNVNPESVTMQGDMTITANFTASTTYTLTTSVTAGNGTVDPSGSTSHSDGDTVDITATADTGYVFDHWGGDASGSDNPLSLTMDGDKNVQAYFTVQGTGGSGDLFFSEYIEGSSYNKALEIYNGTGTSVDLGAETYTIEFYFNGNTSPGNTISLSGTVADGDVHVVANPSADPALQAYADQLDGGTSWFNGDDAVILKHNGTIVDSIGQVGNDPGSEWGPGNTSTQNNTIRRLSSVCDGDPIADDAFDPSVEWTGYAEDTFDGLGTHTADCGSTSFNLLMTEVVVTPTAGEFIEIYNPGTDPIDLSEVYLTDATYAGGSTYYYNIVTGSNAGGGGFADFLARFPDGASIDPGEYQTIAIDGSDGFYSNYGVYPTYELFEDGAVDAIPDMREGLAGSINSQGGLTNSGEVAILFYWDGSSDLVQDLDYVVWGDKYEAVDKTGVTIDGPDGDSDTSAYLDDTAISSQIPVAADAHTYGTSWQRSDMTEGTETQSGGNGLLGSDETSENLNVTWVGLAPTPGEGLPQPVDVLLSEIVVTPTGGEFIEIFNPSALTVDLSDVYLTDATYAGGSTYYYNIVTGSNAGGGGFADFLARFPDGATIAPNEYQSVALNGSDNFFTEYGVNPTYELYEDGASADAISDMREGLPGSINNQGGLTNGGEVAILFYWDGSSDLVQDLDYAVWGDKYEAVDKTGVTIDGPDGDSDTSAYLDDTVISSQIPVAADAHTYGTSWQRIDMTEGTETKTGGNGFDGHDETSENLDVTWLEASPTPNVGYVAPVVGWILNEINADPASTLAGDTNGDGVSDYADDEFVEIVNMTGFDADISGWTLSDAVSVRHTFPAGTYVQNGCAIVIFGGGTPTGTFNGASVQIASSGALGLNNGGDTITLNDGTSDRFSVSYGSEAGDNQSITLDPDIVGGSYVKHSAATTSGGSLWSPGMLADGTQICFSTGSPVLVDCNGNMGIFSGEADMHTVSASDADNGIIGMNVLVTPVPASGTVTLENFVSAGVGATATADVVVSADVPEGVYTIQVIATNDAAPVPSLGACEFTLSVSSPVTIMDIQGNGTSSPLDGTTVRTLNNVVTAVAANGFYMQDPTGDGDSDTSDGVFVYTGSSPSLEVGDLVNVDAGVVEFYDMTELSGSVDVTVVSSGNPLPTPVTLDGTDPSGTQPQTGLELERYECMLVTVPDGTTCAGTDGFGDVLIRTAPSRAMREPGIEYPGISGLPEWDGNPEIFEMNTDALGLAHQDLPGGVGFTATGIIAYSYEDYQLHPTELTVDSYTYPIPASAPSIGDFKLATQNMYRLFDDIDNGATDEPVLTAEEYGDRLEKASRLVREILQSPDILGVQEVETLAVLSDLADRIAVDDPSVHYTPYLMEGNDIGGIDIGFLVRDTVTVDSVTQVHATDTFEYDGFTDYTLHDRPPLLLEGTYTGYDTTFPISVLLVHSRSLSGIDGTNSEFVKTKRRNQAEDIAQYIQSLQVAAPDIPLVVMGDFNAYEFTDGYVDVTGIMKGDVDPANAEYPGTDYIDPNLTDQTLSMAGTQRYSYVQHGTAQALDHILTGQALSSYVQGVQYGRACADAPSGTYSNPSIPTGFSDHDGMILTLRDEAALYKTVTFEAGTGGSLDGDTLQTVYYGNNCSDVTAIPDPGYTFTGWTGDISSSDNPLGVTNVVQDMTVTANFALSQYTILATAGTGGGISPAGETLVTHGTNRTFTFIPDDGFCVGNVIVDGQALGILDFYTFEAVTGPHTIHVDFDTDLPPVIDSFTLSTGSGNAPLTVDALVTAHDPDGGGIVQYTWEIQGRRNDTVLTGSGMFHYRYALPGVYTLQVTVFDNEGSSTTSEPLTINVSESSPVSIPLPMAFNFQKLMEKLDITIVTRAHNIFDEEAAVELDALDEDGLKLGTRTVTIPAHGSAILDIEDFAALDFDTIQATADRYLVLTAKLHNNDTAMTVHLDTDFQALLTIPHIAEETGYWDTLSFLSNSRPDLLEAEVAGLCTQLSTADSGVYDMETLLPETPVEQEAWGRFLAHASDPFSNPATLSGFELFVKTGSDGAAVELAHQTSQVLYVPHIPEETEIFWTGFAIVNPNDNPVNATAYWYTDDGQRLGTTDFNIGARSKLKGLMTELFPGFAGTAQWALIIADGPLTGIEIYGTHDAGICGLQLPTQPHTHGILTDIRTGSSDWTGVAITNVTVEAVNLTLELMDADGNVKSTRTETLAPMSRFKAVVSDYFNETEPADGDYIRYTASGPVVALEAGGDMDRTIMTALTGTR